MGGRWLPASICRRAPHGSRRRAPLAAASPLTAPKGKIPFATHGSSAVSDSHDIVAYLLRTHSRESGGRDMAVSARPADKRSLPGMLGDLRLPGSMDPGRLGAARALEALLEHRSYYHTMMHRWGGDAGFEKLVRIFFGSIPALLRPVITTMVRKQVWATLRAQGIAAHADEDIASREREDWDTVAAVLGGTPGAPRYLGGDHPCAEDCTLFAALDSCLNTPFPSEGKRYLLERHPALVDYCDAFRSRFFPEAGPPVDAVRRGNAFMFRNSV